MVWRLLASSSWGTRLVTFWPLISPWHQSPCLADDVTIADDNDYFLCLPTNTKFVAWLGMRSGHTIQMEVQLGLPKNPSTEVKQTAGQGWSGRTWPGSWRKTYPASSCRLRRSSRCSLMFCVWSWLRNSAKVMWQSRGSSRCLTRKRKPVSPGSSWDFTSGLWRRKVASYWSSKSPELTSGTRGTLLTRLLERAPPKLHLRARSSWR